jgi:hypothetical protein
VRKRKRKESKEVMKKEYFLLIACVLMLVIASIPEALCYPPAGSDYMASTTATIQLEITGMFTETVTANGPTNVTRGTPYNPGNGRIKIDTEIVYMRLTGYSSHIGPITILESPSKKSNGTIQQKTAGIDFPADSFFDVYIEIHTVVGTFHNDDPKRMNATIYQIPPYGTVYEGPQTIPLKNATDYTIGYIKATNHTVEHPLVGGIWIPVDKFVLLAPYIALASTILVATAATAIYIKRRNKKQ